MSHAFISYHHADKFYASTLATAMEEQGLPVRFAERIEGGAQWENVIENALTDCRAFVVIVSQASRMSMWVKRELAYAERLQKPIRPILLDGEGPWLSLESLQFFDSRSMRLPPEDFFERIAADLCVDLKRTHPVKQRSPGELALFDATVERLLEAMTADNNPVYLLDYSRAACARVDHTSSGANVRYVNLEVRLDAADPRLPEFQRSLDLNGAIAGQTGWSLLEANRNTIVNGVRQRPIACLHRSLRLAHQEFPELRQERTDPVNRACAHDLIEFFELAMESRLRRLVIERSEPFGWLKRY